MAENQGKTRQLNITDAAIKRLADNTHVRKLRDSAHGNLYFRYHTGRTSGTWYLVTHSCGKRWRKLGRWPEIGAKLIKQQVPAALAESDASIDTGRTLGDVLTWYSDRVLAGAEVTPERAQEVAGIIKNHLLSKPRLVSRPLTEIDRPMLDRELVLPLQSVMQPATIQKVFQVLKAATARAEVLDVVGSDPLATFKFSEFNRAEIEPKAGALRMKDTPEVLDGLADPISGPGMLAMMMLLHGTRITETRLARWRDIDLKGGWWHIPAKHTKTRKAHRLPLTAFSSELLTAYRAVQPGTVLFGSRAFPISRSQANQWIKRFSGGEWTAHDLRKLARTVWADIGIDYMIAELLLNHSPGKLDRVYIHTYADQKARQALEQYHEWIAERMPSGSRQTVERPNSHNPALSHHGAVVADQ